MSRKLLLLLIVIGLGLSMIACTMGRSQRYPRYPNYPYPGGQGYPQYPGYPPGYNGFEQVRTLADDLKEATAEVAEEAKETEQSSHYEENTIERLEDLDKEAKDFHENIDKVNDRSGDPRYRDPYGYRPQGYPPYGGDPRYGDPRYRRPGYQQDPRAREQFTELLQKYYSARKILRDLPEDEVQKDFQRVTGIMRNLTRFYGYRFEPDYEYLEPTIR